MKKSSTADRIDRLNTVKATADKLAVLLDDDVQKFFDDTERVFLDHLLANDGDAQTCQAIATQINAVRALRAHIESLVDAKAVAERQIEKILNREQNNAV